MARKDRNRILVLIFLGVAIFCICDTGLNPSAILDVTSKNSPEALIGYVVNNLKSDGFSKSSLYKT